MPFLILAFLILCVLWVGFRALAAKADLESALPLVTTLKSQILAQNVTGAEKTLAELKPKVGSARGLTSDPIWRLGELVPGVGPNLSAVRTLAGATADVVDGGIDPLVGVLGSVSPASFKPVNGAIDIKPITAATPKIDSAAKVVATATRQVGSIDTSGTIGAVQSATKQMSGLLAKVDTQLGQVKDAVHVLPGAMGADGPRNYLIIFENSGELLANGGTTGSMALLNIDKGKISLVKQASASAREFPAFSDYVIPIPEDVKQIYPYGLGRQVQDLTVTPRFPLTYDVAKAMWKSAKGDDIDGVIAIDTVALSYLLKATGPIPLPDGSELTSENAVRMLLIDIYTKYTNPAVVDQVNQAISVGAFTKVLGGGADPKKLIAALLQAGDEGRVKVWTGRADEQALIKLTPFYRVPPPTTSTEEGFGVYFMDQTPSKLGFFLKQQIGFQQAVCSDNHRYVLARVTLTNQAPADAAVSLPPYVLGSGVLVAQGRIRIATMVYAPQTFSVVSVGIAGQVDPTNIIGTDGEFVVGEGHQEMGPGESVELDVLFDAGETPVKKAYTEVTPTINPSEVKYGKFDCALINK